MHEDGVKFRILKLLKKFSIINVFCLKQQDVLSEDQPIFDSKMAYKPIVLRYRTISLGRFVGVFFELLSTFLRITE